MAGKFRGTLIAVVLLAFILTSVYLSTLLLSENGFLSRVQVHNYSDANEVSISDSQVKLLLGTIGQIINVSDLQLLHEKLAGVVQTTPTNDLLGQYTRTLFDLSGNLSQIRVELKVARSFLDSGDRIQASSVVRELKQRRDESGLLLHSSRSLLVEIGQQYQVDTTVESTKLNALNQLYQGYSVEINQLSSELSTQALIPTVLSLNSSASQAFVGQTVLVYGFLRTSNRTALENRTVTISWALRHIAIEASFNGYFEANVSFPVGSTPGFTVIAVAYVPSGPDALLYLSSTASIQVQLFYEPTDLTAVIGPTVTRPLGSVDIWGNLSSTRGQTPLVNRTIVVQLDGALLGNVTTNKSGSFFFYFTVPRTTSNGTHIVEAVFNATNDLFAPSKVSLPFNVEILETQPQILFAPSTILSGMRLGINGTISYANFTDNNENVAPSGNVTIYLDNTPLANGTLNRQGSFISQLPVGLGTSFGQHSIIVQYTPDEPWLQSSQATVGFYVINTPLVALTSSIVAIAAALGAYAVVRNKRKVALETAKARTQLVAKERPVLSQEFSPSNLKAALETQTDSASKIKRAYSLAQNIIGLKLGLEPRTGETPSEYVLRVAEASPSLNDPLEALVDLFTFAEYSPYPIEAEHAKQARERLLELRAELENVKASEDKH